jgi:hypothetical protein
VRFRVQGKSLNFNQNLFLARAFNSRDEGDSIIFCFRRIFFTYETEDGPVVCQSITDQCLTASHMRIVAMLITCQGLLLPILI